MAPRIDTDDLRDDLPQTDESKGAPVVNEQGQAERGQSETDDAGDIADEGPGHRG
jgi:hypothetical protein